jgi:hypothetical protein
VGCGVLCHPHTRKLARTQKPMQPQLSVVITGHGMRRPPAGRGCRGVDVRRCAARGSGSTR